MRTQLADLHFGDKAWFVVEDGNARIEVDFQGQTYELSMVRKSSVGFDLPKKDPAQLFPDGFKL